MTYDKINVSKMTLLGGLEYMCIIYDHPWIVNLINIVI